MDRSSGFGQPTYPPSHYGYPVTVALWVFVPFTAAGQRGLLTPLPDIHLYVTSNKVVFTRNFKKETLFCQVPKKPIVPKVPTGEKAVLGRKC